MGGGRRRGEVVEEKDLRRWAGCEEMSEAKRCISHCWYSWRSLMVQLWGCVREYSEMCHLVNHSDIFNNYFWLFFTPSVACSVSSHTSLTQQSAPLVKCIKKFKASRGEEGGEKKRICNSAASSPNYSEALLKSATRAGWRKEERKRKGHVDEEERGREAYLI